MDLEDRLHRGLFQRIRRTISPYLLSASLGVFGYACGNGSGPSQPQGCVTDQDCKADRVCYQGQCIYPQGREEQPDDREEPVPPPREEPGNDCVPQERLECRDNIVYQLDNCGSERVYERCGENQRCVVDRCEDSIPGECQNGQREEIPCGLNNNGTLEKVCRSEQWQYAECNDPDECRLGEQRTSYSGPQGTLGVGACQSRLEECVEREHRVAFRKTRDEVLPSEEFCGNDKDDNCDGINEECLNKILFARPEESGLVYIMNSDGTQQQRIGNCPQGRVRCEAYGPHWSPDATQIVYIDGDITVMHTDGTNVRGIGFGADWVRWSPDGQRLALSTNNSIMATVNIDGTNLQRFEVRGSSPSWSPDGREIVFSNGDNIYVMDADGNNQQRLTNNPLEVGQYGLSWSTNGTVLFVARRRPDNDNFEEFEVYKMDGDGNHITRITVNNFSDSHPALSPNGQKVAFVSEERDATTVSAIYTINIDGSGERRLSDIIEPGPNNWTMDLTPQWAPDGRKIAYYSRVPPNGPHPTGIFIMNQDGTNKQFLSDGKDPHWSPNGRRIVFVGEDRDIYTMNTDGSNVVRLTSNGGFWKSSPRWSNDGTRIAFSWAERANGPGLIYVMDSNGRNLRRITEEDERVHNQPPRSYKYPSWSPDDSKLVALTDNWNGVLGLGPIVLIGINNRNQVELNPKYPDDIYRWPSWSPDRRRITFTAGGVGKQKIYTMDSNGNDITQLTEESTNLYSTWSPDSQSLAFICEINDKQQICRMSADGGNRVQLTNDDQSSIYPAWSPQ